MASRWYEAGRRRLDQPGTEAFHRYLTEHPPGEDVDPDEESELLNEALAWDALLEAVDQRDTFTKVNHTEEVE